ncbi:MAG: sigma-54-dependent transcriptional regulator [Deltaproteobacteria bacterium]
MISFSIHIVDDEEFIRQGIADALAGGYAVKTFASAEAALEEIGSTPPDLVLLDIGLPGMSGLEALRTMKQRCPEILVIMITAYEDVNSVVAAMKCGAHDYIVKPIHMESLEMSIRNALETIRLRKEVRCLQERYLREHLPCYMGESREIRDVMDLVKVLAASPDTPVLVLGETGTGKELVASAIHYGSPNFRGPFVSVNCASIPKELIESELFGYERGAFTGAKTEGKKGLVEQAEGGTLFLDEVGDLSLEAQAKLLRFLEEGDYYRVGGTKKLKVTTRVVSATNRNPESLIEKGLFRQDLYYRLAVVKVEVPSLDRRREDIVPIAMHFLVEFSRKFNRPFTGISPEAREAIMNFHWRGNVRELRNAVERGVLIGKGPELEFRDLGIGGRAGTAERIGGETPYPAIPPEGMDLRAAQESMEKFYLQQALRATGGNESRAAALLNLNHHTFRYRCRKLGF